MTALAAAAPAGHADPIAVILLVLGIAAGYAVSLYLLPVRTCTRCRGTRVTPGSGRRVRSCKRCGGTWSVRKATSTSASRSSLGASNSLMSATVT